MSLASGTILRRTLVVLAVLLIVIQVIPVTRDNPAVEFEVPAPDTVRAVLRRACYDCHSNETVWPWYSRVAPFSWLLARDVHEGRRELNFSTWNRQSAQREARKMKETRDEVSEGEMPPWYYVIVHRSAALSSGDSALLVDWAAGAAPTTR